ncbi:MAG: pentapeptide repeat-containing protein [Flavobacteriales bacterium]|nr:pentapeptide repeat-containing protein [Flavobacteriales bacterium]
MDVIIKKMGEQEIKERIVNVEARLLEQEHRLLPVWLNFFRRNRYGKNDKRRSSTLKALLWSFVPKPTPTVIAISLISIVTMILAYEANIKLENQNTLLLIQNELQESQRRASLNIEISSIMQQINNDREAERLISLKDSIHTKRGHKRAPYLLSDITAARITSISRSLRPYRVLKTDRMDLSKFSSLSDFFDNKLKYVKTRSLRVSDFLETDIRSPEREQLLVALITMRISFSNIGKRSNFDYSNIQGFDISRSDLQSINLNHSNLSDCAISYTFFDYANIKNTDLSGVYGTAPVFVQADLEGSSFKNSVLNNINFKNAHLKNVDFTNADLMLSNFENSTLDGADFTGANLTGADFKDINDLSLIKSLKSTTLTGVKNLSDSLIDVAISRGAIFSD